MYVHTLCYRKTVIANAKKPQHMDVNPLLSTECFIYKKPYGKIVLVALLPRKSKSLSLSYQVNNSKYPTMFQFNEVRENRVLAKNH